jgi:hypothetical protein
MALPPNTPVTNTQRSSQDNTDNPNPAVGLRKQCRSGLDNEKDRAENKDPPT